MNEGGMDGWMNGWMDVNSGDGGRGLTYNIIIEGTAWHEPAWPNSKRMRRNLSSPKAGGGRL